MADVRPILDEETIRDCHDDLLHRVQVQRGEIGVPVPDDKTARDFLDPIMQQIVVEHERDRRKDLVRPDPPPFAPAHDWYKEAEHSPRMTDIPGTRGEFVCHDVGTVDWNLASNVVTARPGFRFPVEPKRGPLALAVKRRFRELSVMPEWRARMKRIAFGSFTRAEKEAEYRKLLADSVRLFGSPMSRKPKRVQVG